MAIRHVTALAEDAAIDLSGAIRSTEEEVMRDAMGEEPLDNDGDHSLEDMGEGLEGDELNEDDAPDAGEGEGDGEQDEDEDGAEGEGEDGAEEDDEGEGDQPDARAQEDDRRADDRRDPRQADRGRVPPHRLREATERERAATTRADRLEAQLAAVSSQLSALSQQRAAPTQQQAQPNADPEPDIFADPDGWKAWNKRAVASEAQRIARDIVGGAFQQDREARINTNMHEIASGDRGFEFREAYNRLTSLNPADPAARATVARIMSSGNPGQAVLDWFEQNGASEWRERLLAQLSGDELPNPLPRRGGDRGQQDRRGGQPQRNGRTNAGDGRGGNDRQGYERPRVAFEGRRSVPSLNSASGSGRADRGDPEMLDNSDSSVFRFATGR